MNSENYDLYDRVMAEWYSKVVSQGYHNQLKYVNELLQIIPEGSSTLELGCGAGDTLIPLIKEERVCEGIDKSQDMLAKLHSRQTHIVTYPFDVRDFTPKSTYDFVFSCNGVFSIKGNELESYLLKREELIDCLRRYSAISKNGLVVNKGVSKDSIRLPLNGIEFVHKEIREGDIMVMVHLLFDDNKNLLEERTHVKRRYPLDEILQGTKLRELTENFYLLKF